MFKQWFLAWLFSFLLFVTIVVFHLVTLGLLTPFVRVSVIRFWGRGMLWFHDVTLELPEKSFLEDTSPRVILFNHASTLDMYLVTSIYSPNTTSVTKKEFIWIPLLGLVMKILGFVFLDRKNKEKARQSMEELALKITKESLSIAIAPEGTRSKNGFLGEFKKGSFKLAMNAGVPIQPVVLIGGKECWPYHEKVSRTGTVRVKVLPSLLPSEITEENMDEVIERVRQQYKDVLGEKTQL